MGMGCRALALVGLAATLSASAALAASPFDFLGGGGSQGGSQGGGQGGKKKPLTMVMPAQSLPVAQQLNRGVNFNRVGLSQTAIGGANLQTAVVQVSQMGGGHPKTMFLPYGQLGPMQALNTDLNFNVVAVTQLAIGYGNQQVAIVNVDQKKPGDDGYYEDPFGGAQGGGSQGGGSQGGGSQGGQQGGLGGQQGGTTMVAPWEDLPTLKQGNAALNFNVVRVSQTAIGDGNSQTAVVQVGQENGGSSPLGTPMFLPAHQLGAYKALNLHLNINVVAITQVAIGNGNSQMALVLVGQK
jgi:hypothetical protein